MKRIINIVLKNGSAGLCHHFQTRNSMIIFFKVNKTFTRGSVVFNTRTWIHCDWILAFSFHVKSRRCIILPIIPLPGKHVRIWKCWVHRRFGFIPFGGGGAVKCLSLTFGAICVVICNMENLRLDVGSRNNIFVFVFAVSNLIFFV